MALDLLSLSPFWLSLPLFHESFIKKIRGAGEVIEKVMGGFMVIVGLYLIYFAIYELSFQYGWEFNQGISEFAFSIQGKIIQGVSSILKALNLI